MEQQDGKQKNKKGRENTDGNGTLYYGDGNVRNLCSHASDYVNGYFTEIVYRSQSYREGENRKITADILEKF